MNFIIPVEKKYIINDEVNCLPMVNFDKIVVMSFIFLISHVK